MYEDKIALIERAGVTDEFIDEAECQIEMDKVAVVTPDRKARTHGMTRSQYISALATA